MSTEKEFLEIIKSDIEHQIGLCNYFFETVKRNSEKYRIGSHASYYEGKQSAYEDVLLIVENCIERINKENGN